MKTLIIDYGLGNLRSVRNALKYCGVEPVVSENPAELSSAAVAILPGVGAFEDGMKGLRARGWITAIEAYVQSRRPLLGICLGMQLLMSRGHEFGRHDGLGLIAGEVVTFDPKTAAGGRLRVPHMGWNGLKPGNSWEGTILAGLHPQAEMYFVHSYFVAPENAGHILAMTDYGGQTFCSVLASGNVYGCQFHPERSAAGGLMVLKNFIGMGTNQRQERS